MRKEGITASVRLAILATLVVISVQLDRPAWAAGSGEVLYAHARVEEILSPVVIKMKLLENKRVIQVRLQGLSAAVGEGHGPGAGRCGPPQDRPGDQ